MIVCGSASLFRHDGCKLVKLEDMFVALLDAHVLDTGRLDRTWDGNQLVHALVAVYLHVLARHVVLCLRRFLS